MLTHRSPGAGGSGGDGGGAGSEVGYGQTASWSPDRRGLLCPWGRLLGSGPREASSEALSPPGPDPPGNGAEVTAAASVRLPLGLRAVVWGTWGPR